jgi:hypothetical protein
MIRPAVDGIGLNVRKLVALDMVFLGRRVIVAEYAAGVVLCGLIGVLSLGRGALLLGIPLLWIGLNYVPLFLHAVDLARSAAARQEVVADELEDPRAARSYSWRQLWILVPLAVVTFDGIQRLQRRT